MMADEPRLLDLFGQLGSAAIQDAIPAEFQTVEPVSVPERAVVIDDARPGILVRGNQPEQQAFLCDCRTGHTLASGGFGSGKSWVGSRKFIALHRYNGCAGMMLAPTWGDLARVMAPYLIRACMELGLGCHYWPHGHGAEQFPHMTIFGQVIYLFSGDAPERITGVEVGHGWADESARFVSSDNPIRDAPTQIVGRLRHPKARTHHFLNTTTPEGLDTWLQRDFYDKPKPNHRAYVLATVKNTALPAAVIEGYKAQIPEALKRQYLEGYAVDYAAGRAHPNFTMETHCRPIEMDLQRPVHIGADFNVSPMCWVAAQMDQAGNLLIFDELILEDNAQVDRAVQMANDKLWCGRGRRVGLHPDKSAKARSTTGNSEINMLIQTAESYGWKHDGDAYGANPPIISRINLVERNLLDATRRIRIYVDPRCTRLIFELQRVKRKPDGSYDPGKDKKWGHILDALGYLVWDMLPIEGGMKFSRY
jgi:hypothetical protein